MKRSAKIRIISFALALASVFGGLAVAGFARAAEAQREADAVRYAAVSSLLGGLSRMDGALIKSQYAASEGMSALLAAEIWKEAASAKAAMAILPAGEPIIERTHKLIAQSGAYAYTLLKKSAAGEKLSEDERENLARLRQSSDRLLRCLSELAGSYENGEMTFEEVQAALAEEEATEAFGEAGGETAGDFPEYASLIYDGPFSDHIEKRIAQMPAQADEIDREKARRRAAEIAGLPEEYLSEEGAGEGKIETRRFSGVAAGGETRTVELTRYGGFLLNYTSSRIPGQPALSAEECMERAREFLSLLRTGEMKESYYHIENDVVTVNFASVQDRVVCYPDLIKVSVAQDTGEVLSAECYGYLMNHRTRENLAPKISMNEARAQVAEKLTILSEGLALIPTSGENEKLCYEFKVRDEQGGHALIYIDAENGREENILILIEDKNGSLTL